VTQPEKLLTASEATKYLRDHGYACGDNTLAYWRTLSLHTDETPGPKITILGGRPGRDGKLRFGRLRYTSNDLDEFLRSVGKPTG
jgi:hypothetical protein